MWIRNQLEVGVSIVRDLAVPLSSVLRGSPSHFLSLYDCRVSVHSTGGDLLSTLSCGCGLGPQVQSLTLYPEATALSGKAGPISTSLPPPEATPPVEVRLSCLFRFYFGSSYVQ